MSSQENARAASTRMAKKSPEDTQETTISVVYPNWKKSLHFYREQRALQFSATEELDKAIDALWYDPNLREMPRAHVGENTMIVPAEAVDLFRKKGFSFTDTRVVPASELSLKRVEELRQ